MTVTPLGEPYPLGPGLLTIGLTGTELDVSCLVNNAVIAADKNQGDSTTKLCGTVKPGAVSYDYSLAGNMDTDLGEAAGFFALSHSNAGEQLAYTFTPSDAAGTTATGTLIVDPLDFGGDTSGETMTSDFEFSLVGEPTFVFGDGAVSRSAPASEDETAA
jgi:hypothetical protein